jgi:G3E family GTPase
VFTSWGIETTKKFTAQQIKDALHDLDSGKYGMILRAKGIVACADGGWLHFDYVPEEHDVRTGSAAVIGKLCVIGAQLDETAVAGLFGV